MAIYNKNHTEKDMNKDYSFGKSIYKMAIKMILLQYLYDI